MKNPMELTGRTILVTGASSGIGQEICRCASELGARLVLVGRDAGRLEQTLSSLEGTGHRAEAFDLNAVDQIPAWIKGLAAQTGPLAGVVHSAGLFMVRPLQTWQLKECQELMTVNVYAALALARGFRQRGVCASPGSLVYLSSVAGLAGQGALSDYSATKGAIIALTRSAALELARAGIRVNCVAPGSVESPMVQRHQHLFTEQQNASLKARHALGPGTLRDVANAVAFLLGDAARWITGTTLVVDGGFTA